jgi:hypothetical protein
MMPIHALIVASGLAVGATLAVAQGKPVITSEIIVDYVAPPDTLEQAVRPTDAIVVAVAQSERTDQPPIDGASTRLVFTMKVVEVLRGHPALTVPVLDVFRIGGDTDHGDHIIRAVERGFPGFLSGRTYLLFLSRNRVLNAFEPRFGPNGVFELFPDDRVKPFGGAPFARVQEHKLASSLLEDVRRAADAGRHQD